MAKLRVIPGRGEGSPRTAAALRAISLPPPKLPPYFAENWRKLQAESASDRERRSREVGAWLEGTPRSLMEG
jgi:hypothetical protein